MNDTRIKVLIVEDSRSTATALARLLSGFDVVGVARNGAEARRMQNELRPDVITMDILLPDTNGLDLTRQILSQRRVSIIIISSMVSPDQQELVFEALQAGAYDVVPKSRYINVRSDDHAARRLLMLIRAAASRHAPQPEPAQPRSKSQKERDAATRARIRAGPRLLVLGASTGGPAALRTIFAELPSSLPVPVVVALHIAKGFSDGVAHWLDTECEISVQVAGRGERPSPAVAYLPPSGHNIKLARDGTLELPRCLGEGPCPSVDLLFESVAATVGAQAVCLLLTGMGADGAQGLLAAMRAGAVTAVQDHTTSIAFGMPGEALRLAATSVALRVEDIAPWILQQLLI